MLTIGSLFAGIGGLELGLEWSGLGYTVWQVEKDQFCRAVLEKHWPNAARFEDVRTVGAGSLVPVDLLCGGFPCQDVSGAGKGAGLTGSRSGLWYEFARLVSELRPEWVVVENVASGAVRWVDAICADLAKLGYETLPLPLSAEDVGAPHPRARIFIVARRQAANSDALASGGASRSKGAPFAPTHGDSDGDGQPALAGDGQVARLRGVAGDPWPWSTSPILRRVDDGIPGRVDRNRALGNAVVPQCAEVVGWVIRELGGF
jgi:DNA (cytosine-5)-methyltransferase 1